LSIFTVVVMYTADNVFLSYWRLFFATFHVLCAYAFVMMCPLKVYLVSIYLSYSLPVLIYVVVVPALSVKSKQAD